MGLGQNVIILEGIFPDDTGCLITEEEKFSLCHIDVDVYQSAHDILEWIWPRMVLGGIVLYEDYGHGVCPGIRTHVEEHCSDEDKVIFVSPSNHAIMVKLKD